MANYWTNMLYFIPKKKSVWVPLIKIKWLEIRRIVCTQCVSIWIICCNNMLSECFYLLQKPHCIFKCTYFIVAFHLIISSHLNLFWSFKSCSHPIHTLCFVHPNVEICFKAISYTNALKCLSREINLSFTSMKLTTNTCC